MTSFRRAEGLRETGDVCSRLTRRQQARLLQILDALLEQCGDDKVVAGNFTNKRPKDAVNRCFSLPSTATEAATQKKRTRKRP